MKNGDSERTLPQPHPLERATSTNSKTRWNRVLLKVSGEALGKGSKGICPETMDRIAAEVAEVSSLGKQVVV